MIRECIITTINAAGNPQIAPLGLIEDGEGWIIAPFRPSVTLDNLTAVPHAIANFVVDARVFAGCLTGRKDWPLVATRGPVPRLAAALSHAALNVSKVVEHKQRPHFHCRVGDVEIHGAFPGYNRAQNAVLECAILVSRLHMLPREKVTAELAYLEIAVSKTAGPDETEAWGWLMERVNAFYAAAKG